MGYQVIASRETANLSDDVWLDLISLASKYDFSAPRLSQLGRREEAAFLSEEEAEGLLVALERALWAGDLPKHRATEDDTLDRDTVRRVVLVLRQEGFKMLRRTPSWR